ncbi:branched-chain amino acid transport system substrate-binding protein [Rhodoligotrophos appendicifer]|uniref:ABC transporter substrate-binding protein n=1 Tax=Rhodoligotrophos appendicifer TaxID=987056 RepID=UPI001185521A|nr:ABC transporter substrate-binding protein [Rhodoligotrophos appendicifer]
MKKIFAAAAAAAAMMLSTTGAFAEEPYKLGVILPLTGPTADYGADFRRGAALAEEQINAAGGIGGHPLELVYADSKNQAKDGVAEFRRLTAVDGIPAIISTMTGVVLPQFPLSRETDTPMMCVGAVSPEIRTGGPTVFSNYPLADDEEKEIAEFAFNKLGFKKAAIIYENSSYGKGLSSVFISRFKELGGEILAEEVIEKGGRDFRSQLTRLGATKPPLIVTYAYYAEAGLLVRQASEVGIKAQFLSHGSVQNSAFADIAGASANGFISGSPSLNPTSPAVQKFNSEYEAKYGKKPDLYGPYFYDAVRLYASAMERGGYTKEGILKALKETKDFAGVTGSISFVDSNIAKLPLTFMQFSDGVWKPIEK